MNKRQRKKYLKQHNLYVNPRDTWSLDITIAEYVLPRLKLFKKVNIGYPGRGEMNTFEKWNDAIDKMIQAFEIVLLQNDLSDRYFPKGQYNKELWEKDELLKKEGLQLFIDYFQQLWW